MTRKETKGAKGFVLFAVFRLFRDPKHQRAEIDALMYGLYGLSEEAIAVVEGQER